jgi:hypothetical protein
LQINNKKNGDEFSERQTNEYISKILKVENLPYLQDGTTDISFRDWEKQFKMNTSKF